MPSRLTSMDPVSPWVQPFSPPPPLYVKPFFSGVKGHPYAHVLKIYRQMGPLRSKPPSFVWPEPVMKYWWKNRNILPAAQCCPTKRVNEREDFPVSCYNKMQLKVASTGPGSTGSVMLTRINKLLIAGFTYVVVLYCWICIYDEVYVDIFFPNETRKTGISGLTFFLYLHV